MERSECCNEPLYMDVVNTGERLGKSICVRIVYKCSKCHKRTGVVSWANVEATGGEDNGAEKA